MRVTESARKHGISDDDMLHAFRNALIDWPLDENRVMSVGPAHDGELLEVGVVDPDGEDPRIVHAMKCRPRFLPER